MDRARVERLVRRLAASFGEHHLWTYTSAIAFRTLVSLVPLVLLGLALLKAFGLQDVWWNSVSPAIQGHVTAPVHRAIDFSANKIFTSGTLGLIAFASALLLWNVTWAVSTVREALNEIHDIEEHRSWARRTLVGAALAVVVILCTAGTTLAVILGPRPEGVLHFVFGVGRWPLAVVLLGVAVALLVRYAPAEQPDARWASAGSLLVVGSWIVATVVFAWYVKSIANFKTATGSLTVFLVLTAYLFTSAAILLIGVQLDELMRKDARGGK
jgi:membrane protein